VTPFELELALQPSPTWTGEYVLNFNEVLARRPTKATSDKVDEGGDGDEDPDQPVFSLVTGKYRHARRFGGERLLRAPWLFSVFNRGSGDDSSAPGLESSSSAVVLRDQDGTVAILKDSAAGNVLPLFRIRIH
jgi:diphthamide biosynthesis protein 2